LQGAGVGGLRHNAVLINWPHKWRQENKGYKDFMGKDFVTGTGRYLNIFD